MALILLLSIDKEEGLVFANWSANGATKLIQVELFRRSREEALGVQLGVAKEFK